MTQEFSLPIRVYIEDTDAGGIVYYVNYLKYFERARTEYMRALGFNKSALLGDGTLFVVADVAAKYARPAALDDALEVTASVEDVGAATIIFHQAVRRHDELLVDGRVTIALVSAETGRPCRLPKSLRSALVQGRTKVTQIEDRA